MSSQDEDIGKFVKAAKPFRRPGRPPKSETQDARQLVLDATIRLLRQVRLEEIVAALGATV